MSYVMGAIVVGGAATAYGAYQQSQAAREAANIQADAANAANASQLYMYQQNRADQQPWMQTGMSGLAGLNQGMGITPGTFSEADSARLEEIKNLIAGRTPSFSPEVALQVFRELAEGGAADEGSKKLFDELTALETKQSEAAKYGDEYKNSSAFGDFNRDFTMDDFEKDPGYQFRMQEGQKAINRSAAAKGGLNSGRTLKALTQYGQNLAAQEYQNAYNRFNADRDRRFNRKALLAGIGQTATNQVGASGQNYANQYGQNVMGAANANSAGVIGQANAWSNLGQSLGNMGMQYAMWNQMNKK